jgi:hypothetical protein
MEKQTLENLISNQTRFGRLVFLKFVGLNKNKRYLVLCRCDCGTEKTILLHSLITKNTISCGCYRKEVTRERATIHGAKANKHITSEYDAWLSMKARCSQVDKKNYKDYGGRGIKVCDRWKDSFENFLADMGEKPTSKHSLDRINNNGNYEPSNCRWATRTQQNNNSRRNKRVLYNGKIQSLADWARELNLSYYVLYKRLKRGWSIKEAFTK